VAALDELRRLHEHSAWANRAVLDALRELDPPPAASLARFAHVLGAERLWLVRLGVIEQPGAVWPDDDLERCADELEVLAASWRVLLDELASASPAESDARLARSIDYVNSLGQPWTNAVADVLLHVPLHGAHHRGQIAAELRALGHEPPYVDWIEAVRRGHVPGFAP